MIRFCDQSYVYVSYSCPLSSGTIFIQIAHLDECAADAIAPATPQSEGAYVANSNTGKFHYAGCRYVRMMSPGHKVLYDSRDEAVNAGFVACKICRP